MGLARGIVSRLCSGAAAYFGVVLPRRDQSTPLQADKENSLIVCLCCVGCAVTSGSEALKEGGNALCLLRQKGVLPLPVVPSNRSLQHT